VGEPEGHRDRLFPRLAGVQGEVEAGPSAGAEHQGHGHAHGRHEESCSQAHTSILAPATGPGILIAMSDATFVEVNGQKTRVQEMGTGDPVVLLHGWGGRIESMAPAARCLSAVFRVIAMDLPGFGDSPPPEGAWGTPDYAIFVRDVLAERGIERAHMVGHSYGGKVSLFLGATHPELVDKLVLVDATGVRTPPSLKTRAKRAASTAAKTAGRLGPPGRKVKQAVFERIASKDYQHAGAMRPILVRVVNEDMTPLMPRVKSPTLLVWGDQDQDTPVSHGRRMESLIRDSGLVVFEGAGHFSYLDQADRFCRVVRHFLGAPLS
jgi:pimeloyl-ACP methyl ester carboxylesterase